LNEKNKTRSSAYKAQERLVSAVSAGAFFILLGLIYVINLPSSLWDAVFNFFSSFSMTQVPNTGISLLAPTNPMAHTVLYGAVFQFCIGLGILQIVFLLVRIMMNSPINKTAETVGNLVYWFGASYLVTTYLNSRTDISDWFMFWAGILVILGVSFVARAFILFIKRR
jgi:hypothetical protein